MKGYEVIMMFLLGAHAIIFDPLEGSSEGSMHVI